MHVQAPQLVALLPRLRRGFIVEARLLGGAERRCALARKVDFVRLIEHSGYGGLDAAGSRLCGAGLGCGSCKWRGLLRVRDLFVSVLLFQILAA